MRKRIYEIVEMAAENDRASAAYDYFQIGVIILSLVPLVFKEVTPLLDMFDKITVSIFIVDYILRLITADFRFNQKGIRSFLKYPFSPMAIIDLLSILPSFIAPMNAGFKSVRVVRLIRSARVVRGLKIFRYSRRFALIKKVLDDSKELLLDVVILALGYIIFSALIMFNAEPDLFENFFDAIYWATILLTTVGYGDIYPISTVGRAVTIVSSIFGIAIVALPAAIITAGYMKETGKDHNEK